MSDENADFDKEAEKQRLREKYEQDQEDREATGRMSELLLQGATMTNKHCDTCGDPIFRYQGEEFCPTCRAEGQQQAQQQAAQRAQAQSQGQQQAAQQQPQQTQQTQQRVEQSETPDTSGRAASEQAEPAQREVEPSRPPAPTENRAPAGESGGESDGERRRTDAPAGGLGAARADLAQSVSTMARRAEAADDPRTAREYLEAAREAAEALAALPR
ncbi:Sjogren's syndrome/scleroderma autoantigen 1 family protein [Halospeciosus flavus]|uniref:Sjogren's syndrome/scleroderma autoantigen 1 family protein n=1 Tax=Halospeciosus flavus TaxID=3032283 RepID=A0ABD5Z747_9EURY|nr:Sjogren's syndrome/scleroderma autoantigen 1 family protein [Halospeciosus flavus]